MSAKQHPECGWRKQETERRPKEKNIVYEAGDNHGFEKVKRKMLQLVRTGVRVRVRARAAREGQGGGGSYVL